VSEIRISLGVEIRFQRIPMAIIIANAFAPGANRDQLVQVYDMLQGMCEVSGDTAQFHQFHDLPGQGAHYLLLLPGELAWFPVDCAKAAQGMAVGIDERESRIKSDKR
jgi:hypothetical protein